MWLPRRAAPACALLLLPLAACGGAGGGTSEGVAAARPLVLRAEREPAPAGEARLVALLTVPAAIEPWEVVAARAEVGPPLSSASSEEVADVLYTYGRMEKEVLIPGPFPPGDFNQVAVTVRVKTHSWLAVQLLRDGRVVQGGRGLRVWSSDDPQRLVAAIPLASSEKAPYDAIRIWSAADAGPIVFEAVELIDRPLAGWVAPAGSPPELVSVAEDQRRATVVTSAVPLVGEFQAESGAEFALSVAQPESLRFPGQRPRVTVELDAGGGRRESREVELGEAPLQKGGWRDVRVPLARLAGRKVSVRITLAVEGAWPGFAYVAESRMVRRHPDPPTVLFVTSDTHRADHLGAAQPDFDVRTPALDALAERGVVFERCFATTNITVPSHVAMMTGVHPRDTRVIDNVTSLAREASTLARIFEERGFRTLAAVSVYHLQDALSGLGQGFQRMSVPTGNERPAAETCAIARRWLDEVAGEPLFLWVHVFDAHTPYEPPEEFVLPYSGPGAEPEGGALLPEVMDQRARYRGEVSYLDREIGLLLDHPRVQRGIVAVTSDHGECLGQHGIYYNHHGLYTDTLHVPLILSWTGGPRGVRIDRPVQNLRLGRTLLDLSGFEDAPFPGRSLLAEIQGHVASEPIFGLSFGAGAASITHNGWHLILYLQRQAMGHPNDPTVREKHRVELFHLDEDIGCRRDLVDVEHERARRMRETLLRWIANADPLGLAVRGDVGAEARSRLEGLGYTADESAGSGDWFDPSCACHWCRRFE